MASLISKFVLSLILGGLFVWLTQKGGVPVIPDRESFSHVSYIWVGIYLVLVVAVHYVRASRTRFLLEPIKPLPLSELIPLNWAGFFAIFVLPLRIGEFARPILTKLRHGISVSSSLGTVAVERVIDGIVASLFVAWGLLILPRQTAQDPIARSLPFYGYLSLCGFTGLFIILVLFIWKHAFAVRLVHGMFDWISPTLATRISRRVDQVVDGFYSIKQPRLLAGFVFETVIYWMLSAGASWLLAMGCGLPISFSQTVAVTGILAIGVLLPAGPGMFGNFQLAVSTALKMYLPLHFAQKQGAAFIFFLYLCQALVVIVAGVIPLYRMNFSLADLMRVPAVTEPPPAEAG